jgi:hypothetical protein
MPPLRVLSRVAAIVVSAALTVVALGAGAAELATAER